MQYDMQQRSARTLTSSLQYNENTVGGSHFRDLATEIQNFQISKISKIYDRPKPLVRVFSYRHECERVGRDATQKNEASTRREVQGKLKNKIIMDFYQVMF